jgi:hypothetical protein
VSDHLIDRAIEHAHTAARTDDRTELRRMMRDAFIPTLRMLTKDAAMLQAMDADVFERAFERSGDADICRAILGEHT